MPKTSFPASRMIADMYARWALDMVVELSYHISNDLIQRPRHYRDIPENVAAFLSDIRVAVGNRADLPSGNDRAAIYGALLDRAEIRFASASLRDAATSYAAQASNKTEPMLRQGFVDRADTLRAYLTSLEGRALAVGHQRTGEIFAQATRVFTSPEIARVFGVPPAPRGAWPLEGVYSEDGAYLIEEVFRTLLQPVPIFTTLPRKFILFQRLAHYGALSLAGVLEDSGKAGADRIDALMRNAYSWARAVDDLGIDTVRAWKDPDYRAGLTNIERSLLPEHPAGNIDVSPTVSALIGPGRQSLTSGGKICCSGPTLEAGCSSVTQSGQICCSTGNFCDTVTEVGPFCDTGYWCIKAIA